MCGRYRSTTREEELARIYRIPDPAAVGPSDQLHVKKPSPLPLWTFSCSILVAYLAVLCLLPLAIYAGTLQDLVSASNDFAVEMKESHQTHGPTGRKVGAGNRDAGSRRIGRNSRRASCPS
jgi:hypothetical protein